MKKFILGKFKDNESGKPDTVLTVTVILLILIGVVAVFSASLSESRENLGNVYGYFVRQMVFGLIGGIIIGFIFYSIKFETLKKYAFPLFLGSLFVSLLVFVPGMGVEQNSAKRWLDIGIITFQPIEIVKLFFIIYLAAWIEKNQNDIKERKVFIPFVSMLALLATILILQPDFSAIMLIALISGVIYFVAGAPIKYLASLVAAGGVLAAFAIFFASYRFDRLLSFLNPQGDTLDSNYQITQASIAIGSGRITGSGLTNGLQRDNLLPEPMNDSIFAVWADETGFIGASIVIALFLIFLWRTLIIASKSDSQFISLIALGIGLWIFIQAFINIGGMLSIMPLTGVPLPYISYGSSAMIMILAATGVLLHISKR